MDQEQHDSGGENDKNAPNAGNASASIGKGQETGTQAVTDTSVKIDAELSHLSGQNNISLAGHNIINIKVDSVAQAREIMQALSEEVLASQLPSRPAPNAELQEQVDYWFQHDLKTDRERFFVVTLGLFNGLKFADFKDVYEMVWGAVNVDAVEDNKPQPRFAVTDDLLIERARAQIAYGDNGVEEFIEFTNDQYPRAVVQVMRRRYRSVLLDLLPVLGQIVERYRYWEIRVRAAQAVAEIAKTAFQRVRRQVLEPWASDPRAYVRAAVGYPLARLAEDPVSRPSVESLLTDWIDEDWSGSGETWRYRWTAASTYKQIGSIQAEWAKDLTYRGLQKIAGFDDIRLADAVIHTLVVLSLQGQLDRVLKTLAEWIEEGSKGSKSDQTPQIRCIVGLLAFMVLSEIHIEVATEDKKEAESAGVEVKDLLKLIRQDQAGKGKYWQLAVAVGIRSFEYRLADAFLNLVARWTRNAAGDVSLRNSICSLLVDVYTQIRPFHRDHIRNRLSRWQQQTKDEQLRKLADAAKAQIR